MSIIVEGGVIKLSGICGSDDVEALLTALAEKGSKVVDVSNVDHLHGAVLQTLLTFAPSILGSPRDSFVRTWLIPVLQDARRNSELASDEPSTHPLSGPSEN